MTTKEDIQALAPIFQHLDQPQCDPIAHYDCITGAIIWSDELPDLKPSLWWNIRPVLTYRTSLATGSPRLEYKELWETARLHFPNWVGFRPNRCEWDDKVKELYRNRGSGPTPGY